MTEGKYQYFDWALFTQVHEIFGEKPGTRRRAEEEADLMTVILDDMITSGFDPVAIFRARHKEKAPMAAEIVRKYREKWAAVQREATRLERKGAKR